MVLEKDSFIDKGMNSELFFQNWNDKIEISKHIIAEELLHLIKLISSSVWNTKRSTMLY